ncbi:MAG: haloacid dehalogenase [Candidatus Micrarchaeota archaeon]
MESKLHMAVLKISKMLDEREHSQDAVLKLSREIIRDCAKAIRSIHTQDFEEMERLVKLIDEKIKELRKHDPDFGHISEQCYQEIVEIKVLDAIFKRKEIPDYEDLDVEYKPWLSGLADVVGELRRATQLALREGNKEDGEYFFKKMNEIYDNLMVLKYSASLVGNLKHKQDMIRGQIEQARSEMLRAH